MTVPPPDLSGTLVLRGAAHGPARPRRRQLIGGIVTLAIALGFFAMILVLYSYLLHDQLHTAETLHRAQDRAQARTHAYSEFRWMLWLAALQLVTFLMNPAILFSQWFMLRRRERPLAETELWLSPDAVTYTCAAGRFTAPKSAVRAITFSGRPGTPRDELRIDVADWGGPLVRLGRRRRPQSLFMPLSGADRRSIAQTVYAATGGQAVLRVG